MSLPRIYLVFLIGSRSAKEGCTTSGAVVSVVVHADVFPNQFEGLGFGEPAHGTGRVFNVDCLRRLPAVVLHLDLTLGALDELEGASGRCVLES